MFHLGRRLHHLGGIANRKHATGSRHRELADEVIHHGGTLKITPASTPLNPILRPSCKKLTPISPAGREAPLLNPRETGGVSLAHEARPLRIRNVMTVNRTEFALFMGVLYSEGMAV
ncbi:MAG: hypothetical protein EBX52_02240 [Proteobacteria bacterium]|nr:hypothetical protein [Pseudomonadota bacterium]